MTTLATGPIVRVDHLDIGFHLGPAQVRATRDVSFAISRHEVVGLVGESGSGKSTIGLSLLGLLAANTTVGGSLRVTRKTGQTLEIVGARPRHLRQIRGNDVAMIFQEPMSSLNPIYRIGDQIAESLQVHRSLSRREALAEALDVLNQLGVPSPDKCLASFPHQLSGGMRQRVMIAMALSGQPALLVADEPTTALDVTIQAQIVNLLKAVQRRTAMAILFITHDLGLVEEIASRVLVMYAGQIVEEGPATAVLDAPKMPYTQALIASRPKLNSKGRSLTSIPGSVPNLSALPQGCSFSPRCVHNAPGLCDRIAPTLEPATDGRRVRCHRWREIEAAA